MSAVWLVNAWRQQLKSNRAVSIALKQAKGCNLQRYALVRQGRYYWLSCSAESSSAEQYDLAICVRRQFAKIRHGIYLAVWQGQLVCIAWQEQQLLHCCTVAFDTEGTTHLQMLLAEMRSGGRSDSAVLLAKSAPPEFEQFCRQQLSSWRLLVAQIDIQELRLLKVARLRNLQQPTLRQQRQRLLLTLLLILVSATLVAWYFWPQPPATATLTPQAAPVPAGVSVELLTELPTLFAGFEHLAGWHWQGAQLEGTRLRAQLRASYGRSEELLAQVGTRWQLQQGKHGTDLVTQLSPPQAVSMGEKSPSWSVVAWQDNAQRYFPELQVNAIQSGQDQWLRWQQWQVVLPTLQWDELERFVALLSAAQMRITGLKLSHRANLQLELTLRNYELLPPIIEDPTT